MQKPAILHCFPRPATAGCTARIWKPYGPQPATGEPAVGKRGFSYSLTTFSTILFPIKYPVN